MTILNVTLLPDAVAKFHNTVSCLAKFSEEITIDVHKSQLILTALNTSKTAYVSFSFQSRRSFAKYHFDPGETRGNSGQARFTCQLYNRALISVFRGRTTDSRDKENDSSLERCELSLQDRSDQAECRLIVKMICRNGVLKTYKLTYESVEVSAAIFDKPSALNRWVISSKIVRDFIEYFGSKTEYLDIYYEGEKAIFTSYTEKIMNGKEILKQPLQTSVAVDTLDFDSFTVEDKLHIAIMVRDFKAIVAHAETLNANIAAFYSRPNRPMQLSYDSGGLFCEFTLMTHGDFRGNSTTPAAAITVAPKKTFATAGPTTNSRKDSNARSVSVSMPPPSRSATHSFSQDLSKPKSSRLSPPPVQKDPNSESLFLRDDDEDRRWDADQYQDEDQDTLGWDASGRIDGNTPTLTGTVGGPDGDVRQGSRRRNTRDDDFRLAPTQPLSNVRGFFDS